MTRIAYCTFGCRLNQYDTETLRTLVAQEGCYEAVDQYDEADIYVVNTCTVTARADANARKVIRKLHGEHPAAQIVVAGCYAQRAPHEIAALPGVSLVVGAADRDRIGERLQNLVANNQQICVSPISEAKSFLDIHIRQMTERSRATVKIQEGCSRHCTFCIIPKTRGRSRSRRPERVVQEVQRLVAQGYQEIVLTGVHLGDYGLDLGHGGPRLASLLKRILAVRGIFRIRLSSIEPASVSDELIELVAADPRCTRHFHIPVQSAADRVLRKMQRDYSADQFARLIDRIVHHIPNCGIGTDVICGFPGESDVDFRQTFTRLRALPITYIHPFPYSLRPGSAAEPFGDSVTPHEKKRRTGALKGLSRAKNRAFREAQLGSVVGVLFESSKRESGGARIGWSDNYLRVRLCAESVPPGIRRVRIQSVTENGVIGELGEAEP